MLDRILPEKELDFEAKLSKRTNASFVLFFLGILWIFAFPAITISTGELKPRGFYFDENSLLVKYSRPKDISSASLKFADPLQVNKRWKNYSSQSDKQPISQWLCGEFAILGLPCYEHTYNLPGKSDRKENFYTILNPETASESRDCIIITTPLWDSTADSLALTGGFPIILALLSELQVHATWLSHSILVLVHDVNGPVSDNTWPAINAFVNDYFSNSWNFLHRAGAPRAALHLDFPSIYSAMPFKMNRILTSGINGELPNMDLSNLLMYHTGAMEDSCSNKAIEYSGFYCDDLISLIHRKISGKFSGSSWIRHGKFDRYLDRLFRLFGSFSSVGFGPSGPHGHFLRHSVDAATIQGVNTDFKIDRNQKSSTIATFEYAVRNLIGVTRSLSNLEEDLHHSLFFYFYIGNSAFVSLGEYAYALAMVLFPLLYHTISVAQHIEYVCMYYAILVVSLLVGYGCFTFFLAVRIYSYITSDSGELLWVIALQLLFLFGYIWTIYVHRLVRDVCGLSDLNRKLVEYFSSSVDENCKIDDKNELMDSVTKRGNESSKIEEINRDLQSRLHQWLPENQYRWQSVKIIGGYLTALTGVLTGLLCYPLTFVIALTTVPMLVYARPRDKSNYSVKKSAVLVVLIVTSPVFAPFWLGLFITGKIGFSQGVTVLASWMKNWLYMGVLSLPLLCMVLVPIHLIIVFMLTSDDGEDAKINPKLHR